MLFLTFLAVLLAPLLQLVAASDPNIGFNAFVNVTGIEISLSDQQQNFFRGSNASDYLFVVPVTITRVGSSDDDIRLTLYTRPYDYDEDDAPEEIEVYQESIFLNERQSYEATASFNLSTPSINTTVYYLRAQIDIQGNGNFGGDNAQFRATISGDAVLSYNATTASWTSTTPAEYAHQENEAIQAAFEVEISRVTEPPIDTTLDTVIDDQDPDLPEEGSGTNTTTPVNPSNPDTPAGNKSTTPCDCEKHKPTPTPWKDHPESKTWDHHGHHPHSKPSDSSPWATPTPSPCPEESPPPPPPPCPSGLKHAPIHARQSTGPKGILRLTLTYGPSTKPVPIRQLTITALGVINRRVLQATGKTDNKGVVSLQFPLRASDTLLVYQISVSLDAEKFRVSTSKDEGNTFLFWRLPSAPLTWQISGGGATTSKAYRYKSKGNTDILNVQDRMLNSWVYAKTKVYRFAAKLPNVWYPGDPGLPTLANPDRVPANYFSNGYPSEFISVRPDQAKATTAMAHEYGHWFHYLARKKQAIDYKLAERTHSFCETSKPNSPTVSFTEGYATAFGLSSLFQSRYKESTGTGYCWFPFNPAAPNCLEIENYSCTARDLSTDEGRVAAALRDLIDTANDDNGGDADRGDAGFSDTLSLSPQTVFVDPVRNNPSSMEEYWKNLKASPKLTAANIDAAYEVFKYQYAGFDK